MSWGKYMISIARHHGEIGKQQRKKVLPGGMGKRKYPDELVALIKLELETNSIASVADFHNVPYCWVSKIRNGTIRQDVKIAEIEL